MRDVSNPAEYRGIIRRAGDFLFVWGSSYIKQSCFENVTNARFRELHHGVEEYECIKIRRYMTADLINQLL